MASFTPKVAKKHRVALDLKTKLQLVKEFENSHLTQKSLAIKYGIGKSTVGDILRHYRTPMTFEEEEEETNGIQSRKSFGKRRRNDNEIIARKRFLHFDELPLELEDKTEDGVWFSEEPPIETILTEEQHDDDSSSSADWDVQRVPCPPALVVGYRLKDILKPKQLVDVTRKVYSSLRANEIPLISEELEEDNDHEDHNDHQVEDIRGTGNGHIGVNEAYEITKSLHAFMLNSLPEGLPYVTKCEEILENAVKNAKKLKQTTIYSYYKPVN